MSVAPAPLRRRLPAGPLVALIAARARRTLGARVGRWLGLAAGVVAASLVVIVRALDGARADVDGFVVSGARWSMWLGAGLVALAAAHQGRARDRRDGLETMAFARGYPVRALDVARALAASRACARAALWPTVLVGAAAIAVAGSGRVALTRLLLLAVTSLFAVVGGVTLGLLAALVDRARPAGGRGVFLGWVLLPWVLFGALGHGAYSIPGALDALLTIGTQAIGLRGPG